MEPLKERLSFDQCKDMTWAQVFRYYFPEATDGDIDFFMWECTPFPFDNVKSFDAIYEHYQKTKAGC